VKVKQKVTLFFKKERKRGKQEHTTGTAGKGKDPRPERTGRKEGGEREKTK